MKNKDLLPENPIESIAQLVQREFREKAEKKLIDSTKLLSGNKRITSIEDEIEIPFLPTNNKNRRVSRPDSPPKKEKPNTSENPLDWKETSDELDVTSPIEAEGSIYDEFPDGTPGETPLTSEESAFQLALAIRKGHEKGRPDIDWHLVKVLYVYGGWGYEQISRECNISVHMVRLWGRKGRWPEGRDSYRTEQSQKVAEKLALEEERLKDWQILKRKQAGMDGLAWFAKAVSNLRDDASPESLAKLGGLLDRMLSSVTGLSPVEQASGGVNVRVENNNASLGAGSYPPNSPQAKLAAAWERKSEESDREHTRRLAFVIRDMYMECERAGLYAEFELEGEMKRQNRLRSRLGLIEQVQEVTL